MEFPTDWWLVAYAGFAAAWAMFLAPILYRVFIKLDRSPEEDEAASHRLPGDW